MTVDVETRRNRFFLVLAVVLAATVLAGFAPTYYFRGAFEHYLQTKVQPYFGPRPLNLYLHLHGAALTAWYALFLIQACLVAARRVDLHRRVGIAAAVCAATIPLATWFVDRSSLFLSVPFVGLVAAGIALRGRPEAHKRLMLIASIAILTPASGRLAGYVAIALGVAQHWWWLLVAAESALALAVVVYDVRLRGRVHPATLAGLPVCALAVLGAPR